MIITSFFLSKIKSETIVKAYIKRIKQIQPVLNCVVDERFDDAIKVNLKLVI